MKFVVVVFLATCALASYIPDEGRQSTRHSINVFGEAENKYFVHKNVKREYVDLFEDKDQVPPPSLGASDKTSPPVFAFFAGDNSTPDQQYEFKNSIDILKNQKFDSQKKTVIYIHGFTSGLFEENVQKMVHAYSERNDHNVFVLDWHSAAEPGYFVHAVPNVKKVGAKAAQALLDMSNVGFNLNTLHIVGHSLGGQMAGVIARTIKSLSNGSVVLKRITALDPAFPGFYGIPIAEHVNDDDAEYVDVIHTDAGALGAPVKTGTVDFWPNNGFYPQPGCFSNSCSHARSWLLWIESLNPEAPSQFNAVEADSWKDFKHNNVGAYDPTVVMGYYTPRGLTGNYYLTTNKKLPFALGSEGVQYV